MDQQITQSSSQATTNKVILILCTVPTSAIADIISTKLIEKRMAACVNILPGVSSIYSWKGKVEKSEELMLMIKSSTDRLSEIAAYIRSVHPYDLPEVLAIPVSGGGMEYLSWIIRETRP